MPYRSTAAVTARRSDATQRKRRGGLASMRGALFDAIYVAANPVPGARFVIELPRT